MASEPERPIEKLLRDAARKRREEIPPGFELHPATRRLLQGEVARQFPPQERKTPSAFAWLWRTSPRLRWGLAGAGLCILIVALVIPAVSRRRSEEQLLVRNELMKTPADVILSAPPARELSLSSAPATPGLDVTAEKPPQLPPVPGARSDAAPAEVDAARFAAAASLASARSEQKTGSQQTTGSAAAFQDKSLGLVTPAAVSAKDDTPLVSNFASAPQSTAPLSMLVGAAQNPTAPAPPAKMVTTAANPASAVVSSLKIETATDSSPSKLQLAQRFVRNSPTKTYSAQNAHGLIPGLLVSFQVEQSGTELRVRDQDGSVYLGYLQPAQPATLRDSLGAAAETAAAGRTAVRKQANAPAVALDALPIQAQNYFFRVAGTNQTLKLPVVFTGNISNPANYGLTQAPLSGARISGRVRVGTQREFELLATPAPVESKPGDAK